MTRQRSTIRSNLTLIHPSFREEYKVPADAVSLSLAYKAAQYANAHVPEAKLQYGFRKTPKNQIKYKTSPNIDEGKLYSFDREVVELKPPTSRVEEEESEEEKEEEEEEEINAPAHLGYNDIGYFPSKYPTAPFHVQHHESSEEGPCQDSLTLPEIGCCGFKPGKIVLGEDEEKPSSSSEEKEGYYT